MILSLVSSTDLIKLIKLLGLILPKGKPRGHSVLLVAPKLVGNQPGRERGEREREREREREGERYSC